MRVLAPNDVGEYHLSERTVDGVASIRQLRSDRFDFRASAAHNEGLTSQSYDRGVPFMLGYHLEDDVVVADDEQSFEALTVFAHFSQAAQYFIERGAPDVRSMDVLFHPRMDSVVLGDTRALFTDNAAFDNEFNGFWVIPQFVSSAVPLQENLGVIGHEYGHSAINHILFGDGAGEHEIDHRPDYQSIHEGIADLFGFALTGMSNFVQPSIGDLPIEERDLARPLTYTQNDYEIIPAEGKGDTAFDPHHHGSFVARAVYEALPKDSTGLTSSTTRDELVRRVVSALQLKPFNENNSMAQFAQAYLKQLPESELRDACAVFALRLAPLGPFEACP